MTPFIKKKEIKQDWYIINAENAAVGRLAAYISKVLRGKNKATYNPHMDNGDFVVVTNIEKIKFSGNKFKNKRYYRHTGYPGGIKTSLKPSGCIGFPVFRLDRGKTRHYGTCSQ